jgi:hypothetical protein
MKQYIGIFIGAGLLVSVLFFDSKRFAKSKQKPLTNHLRTVKYKETSTYLANESDYFKLKVHEANDTPAGVTDKITGHSYQTVYGMYLTPAIAYAKKHNQNIKFMEIGLGCHMSYGPGFSSAVWKLLLGTNGDIWMAEADKECVDSHVSSKKIDGFKVLIGDQSDAATLESWVRLSGGEFDFIVDDGGHTNKQIMNSFNILFFKALKPGGIYIIEDLQVGRKEPYFAKGDKVVADLMSTWVNQLLIPGEQHENPIPPEVKWIFCQDEACAIGKRES